MKFSKYQLKITSANNVHLINAFSQENIDLYDVHYLTDLEMQATVNKSDYQQLRVIADQSGASVKLLRSQGLYVLAKRFYHRPIIVISLLVFIILSMFLPTRVLFVTVEGNENVPTKIILEAAENSGICFGASRRKIRSEATKNVLLQKIPQLQWAGINTSGCVAKISVKEKTDRGEQQSQSNEVCSIVALRDGVIQNCTVYEGNSLCKPGQAVKAGQLLVSGYTDCGLITKATRANAEITALTFRQITVFTPQPSDYRGEIASKKTKYSVRFGKKLIKLYKDSGNLDTGCVKIYLDKYVCLPGGFQLPIAVVKETQIQYTPSADDSVIAPDAAWLKDFTESYLQRTMIAGEIISEDICFEVNDMVTCLYGKYACREMIGQVKYEQTISKDVNE